MTKSFFVSMFLLVSQTVFAQVPNLALTFKTNLKIINASNGQLTKLQAAQDHLKRVVATEAFKNSVINHTYNGSRTYVDNGGYSNSSIYTKILEGAEELYDVKNNTMDLEVELYYENNSTVGYTYPNTKRIYVNTKFFNDYTPEEVSSNLMHEWLHKLGFDHDFNYSYSRDFSVPYAVGYMMEELDGPEMDVLTAPSNFSLATSAANVVLKWNASASSAGIQEYKIYRKLEGATRSYLQGTTTSLTFTQTKPSKSAAYYVKALDRDARTASSALVKYVKVFFLKAPTNVTLSKTTSAVTLKWAAGQSSDGVKEYKIYRRLDGASTSYLQATTSALSFTQPRPSKSASYYVKIIDVTGKTATSSEVRFLK